MMTGGFMAELKRRNVIRMGGLYCVGAWLAVQVGDTLLPAFEAPSWAMRALVITLVVAFVPAMVFAWVFEFTADGLKRDADVATSASISQRKARTLDRAIMVALAVALGYFAFDKFVLSPRREAALVAQATRTGEARALSEASKAPSKSIAVLPLVNTGGDPNQQFFSDGISENLIDVLSSMEGLRVIARSSSFLFRNSKDDPRTIGAKLKVAYLLTGSVQRSADTIRVRAEVIDTRTGATVLTRQFDRLYKDLFGLQDDLARSIADVFNIALLSPNADVQGVRPPSRNLDAYDAFSRGNFFSDMGSERDTRKAIDEYRRATAIDARYAMAWASLSRNSTSLAGLYLTGAEARKAYALARSAGDKALALAPDMGDAHVARGWLLENKLDWAGATYEYQRALALSPSNLQTKFSLASMLALQGQVTAAVEKSGTAIEQNPYSPNWWNWYSAYLSALGRMDEAEAAIRKSIALRPQGNSTWAQLAIIEIQRGDAKAALEAANNEPEGVWHVIARAMALQIGKDRQAADTALALLITDYGDVAPFQVAQVQALRRDDKAVFQWLDQAHKVQDPGIGNLLIDPLLMHYKHDPRMAEFCATVGLPVPTTSETIGI